MIDGRSGFTDVITVKSHLEDVGATATKQTKIDFHHMFANSLADVAAEEAAKRLSPDMSVKRKAKTTLCIGVGVARRWALVQADTWAERGEIYELNPLLEEICRRPFIALLSAEHAETTFRVLQLIFCKRTCCVF